MKHDRHMLAHPGFNNRTESPFVRSLEALCTTLTRFLRPARSSLDANPRKEKCMADPEIPTDEEVLAVLQTSADGLTPSALIQALQVEGHTEENIIRAIQRVFDRNKACLSEGAKLVPTPVVEPAFA